MFVAMLLAWVAGGNDDDEVRRARWTFGYAEKGNPKPPQIEVQYSECGCEQHHGLGSPAVTTTRSTGCKP